MLKQKIFNTEKTPPKIEYGCDLVYTIPLLMKEKERINNFKSVLDTVDMKKYSNTSYRSEVVNKEFRQKLQSKLKGKPISITWAKLYEIYSTFGDAIFGPHESIEYFDLCAAPGIFIVQTEYFSNRMNKKINWHATTLNPFAMKREAGDASVDPKDMFRTGLADDYGLIKQNLDKWLFGPKQTGDITDVANIRSYVDALGNSGINLTTSDCGVGQGDLPIHYNEQEAYNIGVAYGATATALSVLGKGGNYIMKTFTLFEVSTVSLMYLLSCVFDEFYITKPTTSKSDNQELYIVCMGYRGIADATLNDLYHVIDNFDPYRALFTEIPDAFIKQIAEFMQKYDDRVMHSIKRIMQYYKQFDPKRIAGEKAAFEKYWFENFQI